MTGKHTFYNCTALLLGGIVFGSATASATNSEPLYVKNLSPVTGLIGLPSQRSAFTADAGQWDIALHGSLASHYINDRNRTEFVNLDGETGRVALEMRFGIAQNWDVQVEVPWLDHAGGNLDEWIDDWHDFWGMSDGGRETVARDQLNYHYISADGGFLFTDESSGLGDITLSLNHAFYRTEGAAASVVLGYKFGTGDEDDFTGSGADDVFVAVRMSGEQMSDLPLTWHGQVGYLHAGDSDLLDDFQESDLWFAGLSLDWRVSPRWSLLAQVDAHAAPLDSALTSTGKDAYMLSFGSRWDLSPNWQLEVSLVEDIEVETAPDVTFQASLRFSTQ